MALPAYAPLAFSSTVTFIRPDPPSRAADHLRALNRNIVTR
jgi:hypothetical protein